jgi:hypothetical protein
MSVKGTALLSGATVLATWLVSAPVPPSAVTTPVRALAARRQEAPLPVEDLGPEAERLARRVADMAAFGAPTRDLFRFRAAPLAARVKVPVAPEVSLAPIAAVAPVPPPFVLTGIAEDQQGDVMVRTAIVSGPGNLWLVKAGDTLDGRFQVVAVEADAVDIIRADTGAAIRLSFRP